jgi:peroxiredoxin
MAPDFLLSSLSESKLDLHKLSDYRGKKVLLNFWATWCPFCIDEMPLFQTIYDEFSSAGLEVVAINRGESASKAQSYSDQLKLTYALLLDKTQRVYGAYGGRAMPLSFFIDENGVILGRKFGPFTEPELRTKLEEHFSLK